MDYGDKAALKEPEEGHLGVLVALEALSGNQKEEAGEDREEQHHNQEEAWEEGPSYLEAQGGLRTKKRRSQCEEPYKKKKKTCSGYLLIYC